MSIAHQTSQYIKDHPSILDCLKKGIMNSSALARIICDELGIDSFEAVLIAIRRTEYELKDKAADEDTIIRLLKGSRLLVRSKMITVILEKPRIPEKIFALQRKIRRTRDICNIIEGEESITLITQRRHLKLIKDTLKGKIIKLSKDLVQISLIFDEGIETTPGVVSYIYNLLSDRGINILEEMSCWTDLMVVIEESDLNGAMELLSF